MAAPRTLSSASGLVSSIASTTSGPTPASSRSSNVVVGQRSRAVLIGEGGRVSASSRHVAAAAACLGMIMSMSMGVRPTTSKTVARRSGWGGLDLFSRRTSRLSSAPSDFDGAFARERSFRVGGEVRGAEMAPDGRSQQAGRAFPLAEENSERLSYQWPESKNPRICILGGGFGGLYTALRLESLTWAPEKRPQIMLIDQSDRFVFKPMLYEILSKEVDTWEIAPKFSDLLSNTRIRFLQDSVKAVSPSDSVSGNSSSSASSSSKSTGGTVFLDGGAKVDYDWLVLALGAETRLDLVPGALEFALPFSTLEDALEVDRRVLALERQRFGLDNSPIEVIVVGSGYCGVELAATLAERLGKRGKVQVVDPNPEICSSASVGNREAASKVLSSRNVDLELGYYVNGIREFAVDGGAGSESNGSVVANARPRKLTLDLQQATQKRVKNRSGRQLNADLVLWTIGNKPTVPSGTDSDYRAFPLTGRGQADTDETLRVRGHPRIFAIGDSAGTKDSSGRLLPATAQVAFQQADYAGWNLWAAINDRPLLPFRYQHLGEMMTLGRSDGAVTLGFIDVTLDGILGHSARKLAYLYRLPKADHQAKVALSWLAKSTVDTFSFVQAELTRVLGST